MSICVSLLRAVPRAGSGAAAQTIEVNQELLYNTITYKVFHRVMADVDSCRNIGKLAASISGVRLIDSLLRGAQAATKEHYEKTKRFLAN